EIPGTSTALPRIARLCRAFRSLGLPIVHIVRLYLADGSNAEPVRKDLVTGPTPMLRPGTPGRLLAPGLPPEPAAQLDDDLLLSGRAQQLGDREIVLYKPRWGAFFGTTLDDHLRGRSGFCDRRVAGDAVLSWACARWPRRWLRGGSWGSCTRRPPR